MARIDSATGTGRLWALTLILALFAYAPGLSAQVDAESFARLGFNFSPPGAQSAALGGAYIPLAKDATAAETNPAGLTVLLQPEISFEFKGVEYTRTLSPEAGGGTTGREFTDEVAIPSFASVVYPWRSVTLAAFRHELVNYRSTVWSPGALQDASTGQFLSPFTSKLDMQVVNYGASVAIPLTSALSVGVSAGASTLNMEVDFPRYRIANFSDQFLQNRLTLDDDGQSFFANAGVLLELGERVTVGGVYKFRGEFDDLEFTLEERDFDGTTRTRTAVTAMNIPDAAGGGIAIRAGDRLTLSVDAVVNFYSEIAEDYAILFTNSNPADYVADDGWDLHGGAEFLLFFGRTPIALRAGVARVAPSNTYYTGTNQTERELWGTEPGEEDTQVSGGFGLVLGRRLAVDVAGVFGDQRQELVASLGIFLGGQ